ncbi:12748_t:CDS:2 [Funneliformis geosporum]|uniref:Serine hydroxymethyltransferase n=1 Tax=Funneliformis geosporum TaxID=1117311 RepID=A0A9W4SSV2_9GLOM|nr:12748_t:CDS:2 [Funneliformis geosporum]
MSHEVDAWNSSLNVPLQEEDREIYDLIQKEKYRQYSGLELIASENFTSMAVMEANGSPLTNKYSEGLPGARYYGGNEFIDQIENLCRKRALQAFHLNSEEWGVNVQPYSGSTANFAALTALIQPHDRLMGLDLPSGGHLTHGWQTSKKKISSSSIYFESMPYQVSSENGYIDYVRLEENANLFRPKLIICGASAYARDWDYAKLRKIADQHGAYLMADIAHTSGLVAGKEVNNPFELCDVVTTTTHKTLRGPRAGMIFFRKKNDLETRVNNAVFPSCQGGPHNNTISAIAVALKQAASPEFQQYAKQVCANAKALGEALISHGYKLVTGGTDTHLVLLDLRPVKLTGSKVEKICDMVNITINKNSIPGDVNMLAPGGVRLGTSALTSRSFKEQDFVKVAEYLHRSKMMKDFVLACQDNEDISNLKNEVETFSTSFPMPGFDPTNLSSNLTPSE